MIAENGNEPAKRRDNPEEWLIGEHSFLVEKQDGTKFLSGVNCSKCGGWGESRMGWCPWCGQKKTGVYLCREQQK